MFNAILRRVAPIPKLDSFARYLFVGPHPDDIEVACAPSIRALTQAGCFDRAIYVERGTTANAVMVRMTDKPDDNAPYFALVLVPGWELAP